MQRNDSWLPVQPNYLIRKYTDQIYKVSYFPNGAPSGIRDYSAPHEHYEQKLDQSISRSRRIILELGLCNDWEYFCTFTINGEFFDRTDLDSFRSALSQYVRDLRKKRKSKGIDKRIDFLLVPEFHSDGKSWHLHGLFSGIGDLLVPFSEIYKTNKDIPFYLVENGYLNWPEIQNKFGFCTFDKVKNKVACAFYICKYLYKSLSSSGVQVGSRCIFHSTGLNKSVIHGDVYGHCQYLDQFLLNQYDFCSTGFTHLDHGLSWDFALEYMLIQPLGIDSFSDPEVDNYYQFSQMGFLDYD